MEVSDDCFHLFQKYKLIRQVAAGVGTIGTLYEVLNTETEERSVLKVFRYTQSFGADEIRIAGLVSTLPGFIKLKHWFICDHLPSEWLQMTRSEFSFEGPLAYLEMQRADGSLYDLLIDNRPVIMPFDIKSIAFEILYALAIAKQILRLCHQDIKLDNILFVANPISRQYILDNEVVIASSVYQPLIADFGASKEGKEDCPEDINGFRTIAENYFLRYNNAGELRHMIEILEETGSFSLALKAPYFQELHK